MSSHESGVGTTIPKIHCRVVLRGDIVKMILVRTQYFNEQGSSASQMTAAKVMDIKCRLPGCSGQAADAVSAYTQARPTESYVFLSEHGFRNLLSPAALQRKQRRFFSHTRTWPSGRILNACAPWSLFLAVEPRVRWLLSHHSTYCQVQTNTPQKKRFFRARNPSEVTGKNTTMPSQRIPPTSRSASWCLAHRYRGN